MSGIKSLRINKEILLKMADTEKLKEILNGEPHLLFQEID